MDWEQIWKERRRQLLQTPFRREHFYIIILTLLSLILPLAFLLLARLASVDYTLSSASPPPSSLFPLSSLLYTNTKLVHLLVLLITITALLKRLVGPFVFTLLSNSNIKPTLTLASQAHLYASWAFLGIFHFCVVLGIEGSLTAGSWTVDFSAIGKGSSRNLVSPVLLFIGLHETMLHWSRVIVRPVVDDTVFGFVTEERWVERVAMATSFGGLWWWGLRSEMEALVAILEVKRDLSMQVELADLINCWLYYLIVTISWVRLVRGLVSLANLVLCTGLLRSSGRSSVSDGGDDDDDGDGKV